MSIERLGLSHLPVPGPKSGASANSAISAYTKIRMGRFELPTSCLSSMRSDQLSYIREPITGLEPVTYWLRISCATNCAIPAIRWRSDSNWRQIRVLQTLAFNHLATPSSGGRFPHVSCEDERKFIFNLVTTPASGRGVITESSEKRSVKDSNLCAAIRDAGLAIQCN